MSTLLMMLPFSEGAAEWELAACRGEQDPDRWFSKLRDDFDYAAGVCARCPIAVRCADFAAETRQSGVWGGREFQRGQMVR